MALPLRPLLPVLLAVVIGAGCRSDDTPTTPTTPTAPAETMPSPSSPANGPPEMLQQILKRTQQIQSDALALLKRHNDDPTTLLKVLRKLEESTRLERIRLRRDGRAAMSGLSPEERTGFVTKARQAQRAQGADLNREVQRIADVEARRQALGIVRQLIR